MKLLDNHYANSAIVFGQQSRTTHLGFARIEAERFQRKRGAMASLSFESIEVNPPRPEIDNVAGQPQVNVAAPTFQ
jgi:hypothetical protein